MYPSTLLAALATFGLFTNSIANSNHDHHPDHHPDERRICSNLTTATVDHGCIRFTRGFDVTGVTTDIDLTFPEIRNECDCIQACLNRISTCANYVWKFSTPESVRSGHRTCTLYSNFNLPPGVSIAFNVDASMGIQPLSAQNNPQMGGPVPQAFKDANLSSTPDFDAVSGPVWALSNGDVQC